MGADRKAIGTATIGSVLVHFLHLSILSVFLLCACGCGVEETDASPVLDRIDGMFRAEGSFAYEGISHIESGEEGARTESWTLVTHRPGRPLRVDPLGQGGGRVRPRWIHGPRLYWLADPELLLKNYRVCEAGREEIAGRPGTVLEVDSHHAGRPALRLVVDDETGLLLATERRDYRGEVVFRSRFHTLIVTPVEGGEHPGAGERFSAGFPAGFAARGNQWGPGEKPPFRALVPRYLPPGFEERRASFFRGRHLLLLTDGLAWIQLTQSLAEEGEAERVARRWWRGDRAMLSMVYEGVEVRIVGRLDSEVMLRILESLAPSDPNESVD